MYDYFLDKDYLKRAQNLCSSIIADVQNEVRNQGIACQFFLIGSGARNMVTYNKRKDGEIYIDFDYNLNIISCDNWNDGRSIKEIVRKAFNKIWKKIYGSEGVQDSTSSLTSNNIYFEDVPGTFFSIDLGIVTIDNSNKWNRLIHNKQTGQYYWNVVRNSQDLIKKVIALKTNNCWSDVRDRYLTIKNKYLSQNDCNHPSFVCYVEAVNEIYQKYFSH